MATGDQSRLRRRAVKPRERTVGTTSANKGRIAEWDPERTVLMIRNNGTNAMDITTDIAASSGIMRLDSGSQLTRERVLTKSQFGDLVTLEWFAFQEAGAGGNVTVLEWWGQG